MQLEYYLVDLVLLNIYAGLFFNKNRYRLLHML